MNELYELPNGWEWEEWKNIVNIKNGKHYKEVLNPDGKYPIYGSGGIMNYANEYLCNENTTIIGRKGTINSPIFVKEKFWNIDTAFGLEANQEYLVPLFLYYFSIHFNFLTLNKSTTLPSLAKSNLQKILMPLPPLQEQKRIVAKLDSLFEKIDAAIALHQQNIDEAEKFMGSVLDEVFGELEEKYELDYLSNFCQITSSKRVHKADYVDNGIPFYRIKDIVLKSKGYELKDVQYITEHTYKIFNEKYGSPRQGDILITAVGATLGYVYLVNNQDGDFYFKDGNIVWLKNISNNLVREYIVYSFNSPLFQRYIEEISKGAAQPAITIIKLKELRIPLPPLQIQQKTVTYLDQISQKTEQLKKVQQEKLQNLKELKASILDRAFRGEL
jgi:type I restriction enzyme S subunit